MASKRNRNAIGKPTQSPEVDVCQENAAVVVRIPVTFYRRNGRQMVLAQNGEPSTSQVANPPANNTLIATLAKAYLWQEQLESGEFATLDDLGRANGVDRTYVGRVLRLTSLAPAVVESILSGNETGDLSVRNLNKGIPDLWQNY
ncbi:MAG: hypothetical protein ABL888_19535 [Pirellulaceae bacterium]